MKALDIKWMSARECVRSGHRTQHPLGWLLQRPSSVAGAGFTAALALLPARPRRHWPGRPGSNRSMDLCWAARSLDHLQLSIPTYVPQPRRSRGVEKTTHNRRSSHRAPTGLLLSSQVHIQIHSVSQLNAESIDLYLAQLMSALWAVRYTGE